MNFCQSDQVVAIAWAIGEPLEADDAAQADDEKPDAAVVGRHCALLDRLVVEWRQAAPHHVDDARVGSAIAIMDEDLVEMKRAAGRLEDELDLKRLRAVRGE